MAGIWEMLFGSPDENQQLSTLNPQQQQGLSQIFQQLGMMQAPGGAYSGAQNYLSGILSGDPNAFAQFEAPYRQQFEQQTLPGIAERFAGANPMGGGLSSSGFGQALGGAGAQLQAQLAGLHGNLRNQAAGQAMGQFNNLAGMGLGTRAFENMHRPGSGGLIGEGLSGLGMGFGAPAGGALFGLIKKLFGG
jgi:hypothetical protein